MLEDLIDEAAAKTNMLVDPEYWGGVFAMVLRLILECQKRNSPQAMERIVRKRQGVVRAILMWNLRDVVRDRKVRRATADALMASATEADEGHLAEIVEGLAA